MQTNHDDEGCLVILVLVRVCLGHELDQQTATVRCYLEHMANGLFVMVENAQLHTV